MKYVRVAGIVPDSVVDGAGLRTTLFVQGCRHACPGCHNVDTWPEEGGQTVRTDALSLILSSYEQDLTLSGGDPMLQAEALVDVLISWRRLQPDANVWIYTGFTWEEVINDENMLQLSKLCDIMVDGRYVRELRDLRLRFRGSSNQRIIDVQKTLQEGEVVLYEK